MNAIARIPVCGYFNPNIAEYLPLPSLPATYDVHAERGDMKSNIVRTELV